MGGLGGGRNSPHIVPQSVPCRIPPNSIGKRCPQDRMRMWSKGALDASGFAKSWSPRICKFDTICHETILRLKLKIIETFLEL